jgi:HEPN domain-containing protein
MTRTRFEPDDPREWLNRARSNLNLAAQRAGEVYLEELCFNAQQAAEKSIKAVFVRLQEPFPYTHNLSKLLDLLKNKGIAVPDSLSVAGNLTSFAFDARYPGIGPETTEEEYAEALVIAGDVLTWAEGVVASAKGAQGPDHA